MLNSKNKYRITISFNQRIEGILLTLVDGTLETVYSGSDQQLTLDLSEGIYKLKAKFIDYIQEYPIIVDENKNFLFNFDYPSVTPILSFSTTHEYLHINAEHCSQVSTDLAIRNKPNFLFSAAKYHMNEYENVIMERLLQHYSISDSENNTIYQFTNQNAQFDNHFGWLAFSTYLSSGLYFLNWKSETESRIFPFYIYDNYQTQFFIRYAATPDFENCVFFYTQKMCFRHDAEEYLVLDKIMFAFKDYNNYRTLTEKDKLIIQQHPFLVTLIRVLQFELKEKSEFDNWQHLQLPDLNLLSNKDLKEDFGEHIPIISSVMTKYVFSSKEKRLTFKPASLIDRTIDHIKYDLFWNNFSKIDNASDWLELYTKFTSASEMLPIDNNDNQLVKFSKKVANKFLKANKDTIEERLNSLIGKLQSENFESKLNDAINSIGDVSEIAEKLKLPPTKVLRNYETYKSIYNKLK